MTSTTVTKLIYKFVTCYRCLFGSYDKQQGAIIYNKVMREIKKGK